MNKPKIMVLGTFHMRYTPDLYRVEAEDLLTPRRQEEIRQVIERIKAFQPTKLAFEVVKGEEESLNRDYQLYQKGELQLQVDEVHQIGFRLASELDHKKVYAVDWMESVGNRGLSQVFEWAKEEQPELFDYINTTYRSNRDKSLEGVHILELFRKVNDRAYSKREHEMYMNIARIGKGEEYIGIDWVRWWYQRNLIIFNNLSNITENSDRTLLLIGNAHIHLVSQFLEESGLFDVEYASDYL